MPPLPSTSGTPGVPTGVSTRGLERPAIQASDVVARVSALFGTPGDPGEWRRAAADYARGGSASPVSSSDLSPARIHDQPPVTWR